MKKIFKSFISTVILLSAITGQAQESLKYQESLLKIADGIVRDNIRGFVDYETGIVYNDASKLDPLKKIGFLSGYSRMYYPNSIINIAMLELGDFLNEQKYIDYSIKNYNFIFDNVKYFKGQANGRSKWGYPFGEFFAFDYLDDCGAMTASIIDIYIRKERSDAKKYIDNVAEFMQKDMYRLSDGTFCRHEPVDQTIWADDLYMSVPFLARMGKLSGDDKYFDDAIKQVLQFDEYLWENNTGLYYHSWYSDNKENSIAHWGRANGWVAMAQVELLKSLPADHPKRQVIVDNLIKQLINVSKYQNVSGLWHQLLNKETSFLETSGTAMFTYAIAYAVNNDILPDRYISVAVLGLEGILSQTDNHRVNSISMGTGIANDLSYYETRATRTNNVGFGAVLLAGLEILKYEKANGVIKVNDRHRW